MDIQKSSWTSGNGRVRLSVPITKVDEERRTVSGFATLNNLDKQGDIVLASASKAAFSNWGGNLREMHSNIAAGKVVNFREEVFVDPATNKVYEGIYVDAYVSKGAESTWIKVLDGTLSAFSIGGMITEQEIVYNDDHEDFVNVISGYELNELSLVDAPANQFAQVFSVQKSDNGETKVSGIAADVQTVDVYWCDTDGIALLGKSECSNCGEESNYVGWIESNLPDKEKALAVSGLIKRNTAEAAVEKEEGVENMASGIITDSVLAPKIEKSEEVVEETVAEISEVDEVVEKADSDTAEEVSVEKAEDTVEAEVEAPVEDAIEKSEEVVEETAEAAVEETETTTDIDFAAITAQLNDIAGALAGLSKAVEGIGALESKITEIEDKIGKSSESADETLKEIAGRIEDVEKTLVTKKAADRADIAEAPVQKNIWAGRFRVPN